MSTVGTAKDLRTIRRGANKPMASILLKVIGAGHRYRMTRCGVMLYGATGAASVHFTTSDHRASENLRSELRRIGIDT